MDDAVRRYRERRQMRLDARMDDEEETNNRNNTRGHGNTKLPFGLCQREGIEVGKDWTPRDAWEALIGKGITPQEEFTKRKGKSTFTSRSGTEFRNIYAKPASGGGYSLYGDYDETSAFSKETKRISKSKYFDFLNKDELYAFLQEKGVEKFKDPDTGENVNPQKMSVPKTVAKIGERRYKDLSLGFRYDKTGRAYSGRGFVIAGKDFAGKRKVLKVFDSPKEAKEYAKSIGCSDENLRRTADYRKYMEKRNSGVA